MTEFSIQQFEESGRENGIRYWLAHEFMASLGYDSQASIQSVMNKAMGSCAKIGMDPTDSFIQTTYMVDGHESKTYKLTRFACLLVAMHADSRKPEVSKAKAALAAIVDQLIGDADLGRIETRDELKTAEMIMSAAAMQGGLQSNQFGIFKNAGFVGLYNMGLNDLKARKGVFGEGVVLYDFMGLEELAGNLFRVTQTAARIKSKRVAGLNALNDTAHTVGREVRQMMISNSGTTPEALPIAEDVAKVRSRLKSANREMRKLDKPKLKAIAKKP